MSTNSNVRVKRRIISSGDKHNVTTGGCQQMVRVEIRVFSGEHSLRRKILVLRKADI